MKKLILISLALLLMAGIFAEVITIGNGTNTSFEPISCWFGYHRSAALYTAGQIGGSGTINSIAFQASETTTVSIPIKVYLKTTTAATLLPAADWPSLITGLTPLYSGNVSGTTEGAWKTITLSTPFNYTGNNLEVLIESNYGGGGDGGSPSWYTHSAPNQNQYFRYDGGSSYIDSGISEKRPNIQFNMSGFTAFAPVFAASPSFVSFGNVTVNTTTAYRDITVSNSGTGALSVSSIGLWGSYTERFILDQNDNPSPWNLLPTENKTIKVAFNPTEIKDYSVYLMFYNPTGTAYTVTLSGAGIADATISTFPTVYDFGTTSADAFPPLNWTKHNGILANPTVLGAAGNNESWVQDDWQNNNNIPNKAAKINLYSDDVKGWLISPPINIPAADYEVMFDVSYMNCNNNNPPNPTGIDDKFMVLIGDGISWTPANIARKWDNAGSPYVLNNIPPEGMTVSLPFGAAGRYYLAFYGVSTAANTDNDLMVDNVTFRQKPTTPMYSINPNLTTWVFGQTMAHTAATKKFIITNTGGGTLSLSNVSTTGNYFSISIPPTDMELTAGESTSLTVKYLPTVAGNHSGTLRVTHNGSEFTMNLSGVGYVSTITTLPFLDGFEGGYNVQPTNIKNWIQAAGPEYTNRYWNANTSATNYNRAPRTGLWNAYLQYAGQSYLFRPIQMTAGTAYSIKLYARQDGNTAANATIQVKLGSEATIAAMTTSIIPPTGLVGGDYQSLYGVFSAPTTGIYFIGIQGWMNSNSYYMSLDDISISVLPATPTLQYTPNSMAFDLTNVNAQSGVQSVTVSNFGGGTLNLTAANISLVGSNANQFAFTTSTGFPAALTGGQSVSIPVRFAPSAAGVKSATLRIRYSGVNYDVALSATALSPNALSEGFEGGTIPSDWTTINAQGGNELWSAVDQSPHSGNYAARVGHESGNVHNDNWLITPPLKITSATTDNISFWLRSGYSSNDSSRQILISTTNTNPASFTVIESGSAHIPAYVQKSFNLDSYGDAIVYIAIRYMGMANSYLYVDDFIGPGVYAPIATFPWNESFEGATFPPKHWNIVDADGDSQNWLRLDPDVTAHSGNYYAASPSIDPNTAGPLTPNNWLITPPFTIPTLGGYKVDYYVAAGHYLHPGDHYGLYVSTTGPNPADFTLLYEETLSSDEWQYRWFSLSSYAGQTLYFAFRHFDCTNKFYLKIDDVGISELSQTPVFSYTPQAWNFGSTQLMNPSAPKNFALSNLGSGTITLNSSSITLNDPQGNFILTANNLPATLIGFPTYSFQVQFIPQSLGSKTATITLRDNLTRATHSISLSGLAIAEPISSIVGLAGEARAPNQAYLTWSINRADLADTTDKQDLRVSSLAMQTKAQPERGVRGFNIYRNGVQINSSLITACNYRDDGLAPGSYHYAVQAVQYSAVAPISGSVAVSILPIPEPYPIPFTENWSSGTFNTHRWATDSDNWDVPSEVGAANFGNNPRVYDYSSVLCSHDFDAMGNNNVQFSFDLYLSNFLTTAENVMNWEVWNGTSWHTLGSYSSLNGDIDWAHYSYNVSAQAAGRIFKIRFVASGADNFWITDWYIDNIAITTTDPYIAPITNLSMQLLANGVSLTWTAVPNADWYNVYVSENPYSGFVRRGYVINPRVDVSFPNLPAGKAFFRIKAGIGPFPGAAKLFSGAAQPQILKQNRSKQKEYSE